MRCRTEVALDLAKSLLTGNLKASRRDLAAIDAALNEPCSFREIAESFLSLFEDGLLCDECPHYDKRRANVCRCSLEEDKICKIWELAERTRRVLGKTKGLLKPRKVGEEVETS